MNWLLLCAGLLAILVAVVHSALGELWVFNRMRSGSVVPTEGGNKLREPHVRILWASWHVLSVFGCAVAAVLIGHGFKPGPAWVPLVIGLAMAVASALVGIGTNGKHLGWLGLAAVAALSGLGSVVTW